MWLNFAWRSLRVTDGIGSSCEVNWLIDGLCGQTLPTIDLAHVDLAGSKQRPEQHGRCICRRRRGGRAAERARPVVRPRGRSSRAISGQRDAVHDAAEAVVIVDRVVKRTAVV